MTAEKFTVETTANAQTAREAALKALGNKGYSVEVDSDVKIVAKHGFSSTCYPHTVEVLLQPTSQGTIISATIDHRSGQAYLNRLSEELLKLLPPLPTRVFNPVQKPTSQNELNYQAKMLNREFNPGEQVIWSHTLQKGVLNKEITEKWLITNMRAIKQCMATKDNPQERFTAIGWQDLTDSVVMNQLRRSKGNRVGSFAGVYGGGGFAGTATSVSTGTSMAYGDIVFLHSDREVFRFQGISDPNEVNRLIKTLKKESANAQ